MKNHTFTFRELLFKSIDALNQADRAGLEKSPYETDISLSAARLWLNRAQFSLRQHGALHSSDFARADGIMAKELAGDFAR